MSRFQSIVSVIATLVLLTLFMVNSFGSLEPAQGAIIPTPPPRPPITCPIDARSIIDTIAGNGSAGYSGDGGPATDTELYNPSGIVVDTAGNIYIADSFNDRIRKVNASTGIISTIAGTGVAGYSGDGGPATAAKLCNPHGVAVDAAGNIYIADTCNSRVRKVNASTGIISTIAGNAFAGFSGDGVPATSTSLNYPQAIALDSSNNIYIADSANNRVRAVNVSSGLIGTVAGTGVAGYSGDSGLAIFAQLSGPTGIAVDAADDVYIADWGNNRVRMVTPIFCRIPGYCSGGNIYTVAGTGVAGYSGDGGLATSARLRNPCGVAVDAKYDIYIADNSNNCIRMVNYSNSRIGTLAGTGVGGYSGDGGLASRARLSFPSAVVVDGNCNVYISDSGNNRIRTMPYTPEISILGNSVVIANGDSSPSTYDGTDFPVIIYGHTATVYFTIRNYGNKALALTGTSPYINIQGANASDFNVGTIPASSIGPGESTIFSISFEPGNRGEKTAEISIANNDFYGNPYRFSIRGTCCDKVIPLREGWTIISTDKWINASSSRWKGQTPLVYKYTANGFVSATFSDLTPVEALYVKMTGVGLACLVYSDAAPGVSAKALTAGWNLISSATNDDAADVLSPLRYALVGGQQVIGLTTLVSQTDYQAFGGGGFQISTVTDEGWNYLSETYLDPFAGYWIYMLTPTTFGVIPDVYSRY